MKTTRKSTDLKERCIMIAVCHDHITLLSIFEGRRASTSAFSSTRIRWSCPSAFGMVGTSSPVGYTYIAIYPKEIKDTMNQILTKKTIGKIQRGEMTMAGGGIKLASIEGKKSFAQLQMEKMGWVEGQGLGKDNTGMTKSIQVKRMEAATGLGATSDAPEEMPDNWWHNAFSSNLKGFRANLDKKSKKSSKKESKKKSKERASGTLTSRERNDPPV